MTYYVVSQMTFKDEPSYRRYEAAFPAVFSKFKGPVLVSDENPQCVGGDWAGDKVVVLSFPSKQDFKDFAMSADYQAIMKDRDAGVDATFLLAKGFEYGTT